MDRLHEARIKQGNFHTAPSPRTHSRKARQRAQQGGQAQHGGALRRIPQAGPLHLIAQQDVWVSGCYSGAQRAQQGCLATIDVHLRLGAAACRGCEQRQDMPCMHARALNMPSQTQSQLCSPAHPPAHLPQQGCAAQLLPEGWTKSRLASVHPLSCPPGCCHLAGQTAAPPLLCWLPAGPQQSQAQAHPLESQRPPQG